MVRANPPQQCWWTSKKIAISSIVVAILVCIVSLTPKSLIVQYADLGHLFPDEAKGEPKESTDGLHWETIQNLIDEGKYDEAESILDQNITIQANQREKLSLSYYWKAVILISKKEYQGACEYLNRAKENNYQSPDLACLRATYCDFTTGSIRQFRHATSCIDKRCGIKL